MVALVVHEGSTEGNSQMSAIPHPDRRSGTPSGCPRLDSDGSALGSLASFAAPAVQMARARIWRVHSKYSSGYGHHARSRGTLREYDSRRVRLEPREALTHAKERSAGLSLCSCGAAGSARRSRRWYADVRVCAREGYEQ